VTLRRRLALTLLLTAVPVLAALAWARHEWNRRSEVHIVREFVLGRVGSVGRERCESGEELFPPMGPGRPPHGPRASMGDRGPQAPEGWPGPPPGPPPPGPRRSPLEAYTYDDRFQSDNPRAPEFPDALRRGLEAGAEYASRRSPFESGRGEMLDVAVRTGWSGGRCAYVLARRNDSRHDLTPEYLWGAVPLLVALLASVLLAAGPVVQRIRALTGDVQRAAETRYETPVRVSGGDELTELARAFNEAGAKVRSHVAALEQRERTLREFLSNTTHDVMIPLTVLQGHLARFRDALEDGRAVEASDVVPALQEAQYLASLLHNLGAAAKLEAGEPLVERHPVDLGALVERVVARHRPVAIPAGVAVEFGIPEKPLLVEGDVTLIEQAVSNVVHNAVRYNHTGGHVAILLEEDADRRFRLRVLDDGPGVLDDELVRLVERRQRGNEARQRYPGGLGLGLHIADRVAERHGFTMTLGRPAAGGFEVTFAGPRVEVNT
jgi:signal transduction histidine kinase